MRAVPLAVAAAFLVTGLAACGADPEETTDATEAAAGEEEESAGRGSVDNPLPAQSTVEIADWNVVFGETIVDATDIIMEADEYAAEPVSGRQYVMLAVTTTYIGSEAAGYPGLDLSFGFAGADDVLYSDLDDPEQASCGMIPDDLILVEEAPANTELAGNVCISVPSEQVAGGSWEISDIFGEQTRYVAHS